MERLYSQKRTAALCRVNVYTLRRHTHLLPSPLYRYGSVLLWTEAQVHAIMALLAGGKADRRTRLGQYSIRQAALRLGVTHHTLGRLIARGDLPAPSRRIRKHAYWTAEEVAAFEPKVLGRRRTARHRKQPPEGYCNLKQLAGKVGCSVPAIYLWRKQGRVPAPTHKTKGVSEKLYTSAEAEQIVAALNFVPGKTGRPRLTKECTSAPNNSETSSSTPETKGGSGRNCSAS